MPEKTETDGSNYIYVLNEATKQRLYLNPKPPMFRCSTILLQRLEKYVGPGPNDYEVVTETELLNLSSALNSDAVFSTMAEENSAGGTLETAPRPPRDEWEWDDESD